MKKLISFFKFLLREYNSFLSYALAILGFGCYVGGCFLAQTHVILSLFVVLGANVFYLASYFVYYLYTEGESDEPPSA